MLLLAENKIVSLLKKMWAGVKKLPGRAFFAFLLLVGICWYLMESLIHEKNKAVVMQQVRNLERNRVADVKRAADTNDKTKAQIAAKYEERLRPLMVRRKELERAKVKGPTAIAEEWAKYLSKKEKK